MISSSCHCGELKAEIDAVMPETLTSCNCSICSCYGSLMSYFPTEKIKLTAEPVSLSKYVWGDKKLAFVSCSNCGSFSHWESLDPEHADRMGFNSRLFSNVDISKVRVRRFDGADTWKFLD